MRPDLAFDKRVAEKYQAQRQHPKFVSAEIGQSIARLLPANAHVLEIGVGTGRIAKPVADAGCRVIGFDLSAEMLHQLERSTFSIYQGDMRQLALPANTFDATLIVHVLHLIKDWRIALAEAARTLKPSGLLIQGADWIDPQSVTGRLRDELRKLAMAQLPNAKPPSAGVDRATYLEQLGATNRETIVAAEWETQITPAERLAQIEQRLDAESWFLPQAAFNALYEQLVTFSVESWSDQHQSYTVRRRFMLTVTHGNWQ